MLSWLPDSPISFIHAGRSCPTFCLLIWFRGLNLWASYVRLNISQSFGLGFFKVSSVTGTKLFVGGFCARRPHAIANNARDATTKRVRIIFNSCKSWVLENASILVQILLARLGAFVP